MAATLHHQLGDTDEPNDGNASVKKRTNVLLLGDRLGDLGISDGLNYENQIAIGFFLFHQQNSMGKTILYRMGLACNTCESSLGSLLYKGPSRKGNHMEEELFLEGEFCLYEG
ncbi:uncharacterized protein LOC131231088 [Magnolia sinica]|uniref:uncharacterized protein LOC131231088 n=1 Tax=Magnolia sinica TaxID=86752 RepID=UPI002659789E|nr:uncharacterized protein LOC131231088 [Magnolia sinica]